MIRNRLFALSAFTAILTLIIPIAASAQNEAGSVQRVDRLIIPVGSQSRDRPHAQLPHRGMTANGVLNAYGEPLTRIPAVGEPPIGRWEYAEFVVYFENDRVLHAVVPFRKDPSLSE